MNWKAVRDGSVEEKIPAQKLERFARWALDHGDDVAFSSGNAASDFLKCRRKKSKK